MPGEEETAIVERGERRKKGRRSAGGVPDVGVTEYLLKEPVKKVSMGMSEWSMWSAFTFLCVSRFLTCVTHSVCSSALFSSAQSWLTRYTPCSVVVGEYVLSFRFSRTGCEESGVSG